MCPENGNPCDDDQCDVLFDCNCPDYGDCSYSACTSITTCETDDDCDDDIYCPDGITIQTDYFCSDGFCSFIVNECPPEPPCPEGTTLCADGYCREDCGTNFICDHDGTCETDLNEGCNCDDCLGEQDNCEIGLVCSEDEICTSQCADNICILSDCVCDNYGDCNETYCSAPPTCGNCPDDEHCFGNPSLPISKEYYCHTDGYCAFLVHSCNTEETCEDAVPGTQGLCDNDPVNESGCWDPDHDDDNKCCGDETENWFDSQNNICCLGIFYLSSTDGDDNKCVCTILSGDYNIDQENYCDTHGEEYCWDTNTGQCCGDDSSETWTYSSDTFVDDAIPLASCINGRWYIRDESDDPTTYDLWVVE